MANYIQSTLEEGEIVIHKGRLHWSYNVRYTFLGSLLIAAAIAAGVIGQAQTNTQAQDLITYGCIALAAIGLIFILWGYFIRSKSEFAITNTRFIQKDGILNIRLTEIPLFKVETVNFYQSLGQRMVGTGSIELVGSGGTCHRVDYIQQPLKVRKILNSAIHNNEQHNDNH